MGSFSIWQWLIMLLLIGANIPAYWAIKKTGWSGWWFLTLYAGPLGLVFIWVLAFSKWPRDEQDPDRIAQVFE